MLISSLSIETKLDRERLFDHAYLAVLGRHPRPPETAQAEAVFQAAGDDRSLALERLFWVLLNSR